MKVTDRLAGDGRVLVTVPNLELLSQMLATFTAHSEAGPGRVVAVCSTAEVVRAADLDIGAAAVTTCPAELAAHAAGPGRVTVLCTYQSLGVLARSHADHGLPAWDLAVVDEAHRTAGRVGKAWAVIHDDVIIPARRRLYMTATRKILGSSGDDALVSMDDEKIFGPVVFRFSTAEGIQRGLLADYEVLVVVVTDTQVKELAEVEDHRFQLGDTTVNPRTLAVQIAVLRAARQYQITRAITYHNRVRDARTWAQTLPSAWQTMPDQQRPHAVTAHHIDGDQPIPRRRAVLDQLRADPRADPAGTLRVVCNARVLVEGVDAPAVDAIVLVDPRRSVIDTVQAVGRALRTGGRPNKIARILVPVLLGPDEDPESALEGSAYAQVWEVARALRAHDDRLAVRMDTARANAGHARYHEPGQGVDQELEEADWLKVCGVPLPDGFAQAIQLRAVRAASSSWMEYYGAARAHHHAHGHLDLPVSYLTHDGLKLGQWLRNQRRNRAHLPAERVQLLDAIAMPWTSKAARSWERGLAAARAWARTHGSLHNIPHHYEHDGVGLCSWLVRRRQDLNHGRLATELKAALDAIDPTWHTTDAIWDQHYTAARAFHTKHGHLRPDPGHRTTDGLDLHAWLATQRQRHRTGELRPDRKKQLDALQMIWSLPQAHWQRGLAAARAHAAAHGGLDVRVEYVTEDGFGLGVWLRTQRRQADNGRLPTERKTALEAIDPTWHTTPTRATGWAGRYNAAKAYATKHGHLPKGRGAAADPPPDGPDFRPWLREQRQLARRGKLSTQRHNLLNELDPNWRNTPAQKPGQTDPANTATPPDDDNPTSDTH